MPSPSRVLCRAGEADQVALGVGEVADHEVSPRGLLGTHGALVADRLRELEGHGVIRRRKLAPPASSWVYELTEWGRKLEPIVLALGAWGVRAPLPPPPTALSATSVLLFLRACARPDPTAPATTYRLELDDRVWTVRTTAGHVLVQPDEPAKADASLRATPTTFNALLDDPARLDAAMADGVVAATGDLSALRRLLQSVTNPSPVIR